jgi:transposase
MSINRKKAYSLDFRESSVKLALESKNSIAQTARELGVRISTLHTWISKQSTTTDLVTSENNENLHKELKRLKKEISRVTIERDILKKATAYFAREAL